MGFAIIFFAFAALFAWAGEACRGSSFIGSAIAAAAFYQAAMAEMFTGLMYLGASLFRINPGLLFKTPRGRVKLLIRFFCWPYLIFEMRAWKRYRARGHEPLFEEVRQGLFLGARVISSDVPELKRSGISAVLDMIAEFSAPPELVADDAFLYAAIPALDGTAPTLAELEQGARFLEAALAAGRKALVHCTFGHGRSATMAAAALIVMGDAGTPEEALGILKKLERKIWLSREQKRALENFAARRGRMKVETP
ncbi:MAG TPA: dual specificity protein phosphatase family protein [bacterium]|nr:dual specificity protein phosphatase family protein [bacterium]